MKKIEIKLMTSTKNLIKTYDSIISPQKGDIIPIDENGSCFVVEYRMLPSNDNNKIVCFGKVENMA